MALPILTLLALCFVHSGSGAVILTYEEVQKLGNSCPQLESCASVRSRELFTIKEKNCVCDDLCVEYNDCCIDAPKVAVRTTPTAYHCYDLRQYGGVYMKDACPEGYDGPPEVRTLCETTRLGDMRDPLASMPVSDSLTGSTYKNYYCSICHGAAAERVVMWTPRLSCPTVQLYAENMTEAFVIENLTQVGENNWGLYLTDEDDGSLFFHDCEVDPSMPQPLERLVRLCKPNLVSDCPDDWEDEDSRTMCESYMGTRYIHGGDRYKNAHCAMCHGMNVSHLSCRTVESRDWDFRAFETHAFALLLDVSERRGSEVGRVRMCEAGEVFDPFFKMCRSLTCLRGFVKKGTECVQNRDSSESGEGPVHPVVELGGEHDSHGHVPYESVPGVSEEVDVVDVRQKPMIVPYNATSMVGSDRKNFQNCLLISLNDDDFVMFPNESIFVPKYDKMYDPASYLIEEGSVFVCSHLENDGNSNKFVPLLSYLTIFGLCVSMLCLLLHFVAFCYVPDLQNLSGKNLVSQGVSLFCAYTCFCIGLADSFSPSSCITLAFSKYYFFQASYFWMAVIAFDVWRTLRMATQQLRVSNGKQRRRFLAYSLFAWCGPLLTMSIMAWAEFTDDFPELYKPSFDNSHCWFRSRRSLLVYFVAPLILVLVFNVVFFLHSYVMIHSTTQTTSKQQTQANKRNHKLYLRLALLMGLTWVIGIVAGYADFQPLWYAYVLANAFQGFYIFAAFTCSTKVVNFFKEKFKLNARPRDSTHSGSNCHTSSTNLPVHSSLAKKLSSKLLVKKNSESNTSAGSIDLDPQMNAV